MTEEIVSRFGSLTAVVVGDVMLDSWLHGRASRMAQEAPIPVVSVERIQDAPGGAANCAVNLAALGAKVHLLGVAGSDPGGMALNALLLDHHIDGPIVTQRRRTAVKRRIMIGGQLVARYDEEDRSSISSELEQELIERIEELAGHADVVIACDYAAGVCTPAVREALSRLPNLVVDAHDLAPWRDCAPVAVLPNYQEASRLLGMSAGTVDDRVELLTAESQRLLDLTNAELAVTTLDGDGTLVHRRDEEPYRTYSTSTPAPEVMSTGAGDTFTAVFALAVAAGADPAAAADLAQTAAGVVVHRPGTAVCGQEDLLHALRPSHVLDPEALAERLAADRRNGRRVVFTNGCFDVLHAGHVSCLAQARGCGEVLVVAINSDAGVARLKGEGRPINSAEDRAAVLAGLGSVDYITVFDEDTPEDLIRLIRPDVYVKGADYQGDRLPEAELVWELGGEVKLVDYVPDHSTTAIVTKIRERQQTATGERRYG